MERDTSIFPGSVPVWLKMRTRWLKLGLTAALLFALAACGRAIEGLTEPQSQQEVATLDSINPLPKSTTLRPRDLPRIDELPPLPIGDHSLRVSSAIQIVERDGAASYSSGGNAVNDGTSKQLTATAGAISWVVYQLPGMPDGAQLQQLDIDISGGNFTGDAPGYWVGMADFNLNSWQVFNRAQADFQRTISSSDFISSGGNMYVFVLLMDAQSVSIDRVAVTYDGTPASGWTEVTLDSGPAAGHTPSVAVDYYGSVWLAWSDHSDNKPYYAYGIRTANISAPGGWDIGPIDNAPIGKAYYTDLVLDPRSSWPVVSLNYVDMAAGADNSKAGLSMLIYNAQNEAVWLNFSFGKSGGFPNMDGARETTIDFDPVSNFFGMATWVTNANSPAKDPNDMYVRYINLGSLSSGADDVIKTSSSFGPDQFYPHLRFSPAEQHTRALANGALLYSNTAAPASDTPIWEYINETPSPGPSGSLAYNYAPTGPRYGITYSKVIGASHVLFYNEYDAEGADADVQEVATLPDTGGAEYIAGISQLAYTYEGKPLIAYSERVGSTVEVKLATKDAGGNWVSEVVSSEPSGAGSTPQDVQLDLAVEPYDYFPDFARLNRAFVTWRHIAGANGSVKVAYKELD